MRQKTLGSLIMILEQMLYRLMKKSSWSSSRLGRYFNAHICSYLQWDRSDYDKYLRLLKDSHLPSYRNVDNNNFALKDLDLDSSFNVLGGRPHNNELRYKHALVWGENLYVSIEDGEILVFTGKIGFYLLLTDDCRIQQQLQAIRGEFYSDNSLKSLTIQKSSQPDVDILSCYRSGGLRVDLGETYPLEFRQP